MIAKLHRFYGPAPTPSASWLDVPEWLFDCYDRAAPRIEAEEHQAWLETLMAGSGSLKEDVFMAYQKRLQRQAYGGELPSSHIARPSTPEEMRMLVRGLGLGGFKVDIKD